MQQTTSSLIELEGSKRNTKLVVVEAAPAWQAAVVRAVAPSPVQGVGKLLAPRREEAPRRKYVQSGRYTQSELKHRRRCAALTKAEKYLEQAQRLGERLDEAEREQLARHCQDLLDQLH